MLALLPARAQATERANAVLLTVAASSREAEQLEAVARELLGRLGLQVELRRVDEVDVAEVRQALGPQHAYFARVWIAFARSGSARLYLEHPESDRVLVRDVASDAGNQELVREELGHILQTALEGLKAGEAIGEPRSDALKDVAPATATAQAPPPLAPSAKAEPPRRAARKIWRFGPRYELSWLGDDAHIEDGPGASLELALPVGVQLAAGYRRPLEVEAAPVGARLQTLTLRVLLTLQLWQGELDGVRLGAGAGSDFVRVSPLAAAQSDVELVDSTWLKLAVGRLQLSYARRVTSFAELALTLGADVDVSDSRLVFRTRSGESSVFDPWPVRPLLSLGATVP